MPFTAQEIANAANAALDYHLDKGKVHSQSLQTKPLLKALTGKKKTFPGGKENITVRVKGDYTTTIQGFSHDDTVSYANPANIKRAVYPWREIHAGIEVTITELKVDGISVVDSTTSDKTANHSKREATVLANLLDDKIEDMMEGRNRGLNLMAWRDGTQDNKLVPGVKSFVVDDPTAAITVGGIDQGANTWWRNRADLTLTHSSASDQMVVQKLRAEYRQLRRYGGEPDLWLAGSDFLDWLEKELAAKGSYTDTGWAKQGGIDISMADVMFKGKQITYDPTLDDEGESDRLYILDTKAFHPRYMEGEEGKQHTPARPAEKYVMYRAITDTLGIVCRQRNSMGVYKLS